MRIKFTCLVLILVGCLYWGCSRQTRLIVEIPSLKSAEITLGDGKNELKTNFDTAGIATFLLERPQAGIYTLRFGHSELRCFLEDGNDLKISMLSKSERRLASLSSPYRFEGDLVAENTLLHDRKFYQNFNMPISFETTLADLWEWLKRRIEENQQKLDSVAEVKKLSPMFLRMEKERIRFMGLNMYTRFRKWDPIIFDYLPQELKVHEYLLNVEEYMTFMNNGIYVMGLKGAGVDDTYQQTVNQVQYIRDNLGQNDVAFALLENLLMRHIEINAGGLDEVSALLELLPYDFMEKSPSFRDFYTDWSGLLRGNSIPDFQLQDKEGKYVSLSTLKGNYVFIDCWASWCGPCRGEIPKLKQLEEKFAGKDIVFVGVSCDENKDKWLEALKSLKLDGIQLLDVTRGKFSRFFKIKGIPRFILLDKEGKILRAVMSRPSNPQTEKYLEQLLNR